MRRWWRAVLREASERAVSCVLGCPRMRGSRTVIRVSRSTRALGCILMCAHLYVCQRLLRLARSPCHKAENVSFTFPLGCILQMTNLLSKPLFMSCDLCHFATGKTPTYATLSHLFMIPYVATCRYTLPAHQAVYKTVNLPSCTASICNAWVRSVYLMRLGACQLVKMQPYALATVRIEFACKQGATFHLGTQRSAVLRQGNSESKTQFTLTRLKTRQGGKQSKAAVSRVASQLASQAAANHAAWELGHNRLMSRVASQLSVQAVAQTTLTLNCPSLSVQLTVTVPGAPHPQSSSACPALQSHAARHLCPESPAGVWWLCVGLWSRQT